MSGGVWGLSQFPEQYRKLRQNPELVPSLVSEIILWHTPVLHLRRTALADFELGGKTIRKGDKVAMWFVSGNRDEDAIKDPHDLIVDRPRASTFRSGLACIAASATAWPSCSCASCGRRSLSVTLRSR